MYSFLLVALATIGLLFGPTNASGDSSLPHVYAPAGSIVGRSSNGLETFAGIPYAHPPIGQLRLRPPVRLSKTLKSYNASGPAPWCPQMPASQYGLDIINATIGIENLGLPDVVGQEDCLTLTVIRPSGVDCTDRLPVLFWIYGGGFQQGGTEQFDGSLLTAQAKEMGQPFIWVAVNYRINGFGFLAGHQLADEGSVNLGMLDQRMGMQWVADNIASFGGDPDKVTIWGESAGALSVAVHLGMYQGNNTYKGKPLFRGAMMNSGAYLGAEPVTAPKNQHVFDTVATAAGCSSDDEYVLNCLRGVDFKTFTRAVQAAPSFLGYEALYLPFAPRPDGKVYTKSLERLFAAGDFAPVPFINGIQEDEGTLFSLFQQNVSSTDAIVDYLLSALPNATREDATGFVTLYPDDPSAGAPYRTGEENQLYPGFKRMSSLTGDLLFIMPRRAMLTDASLSRPDVPSWSYMGSYGYGTPLMGTSHASDLQILLGPVNSEVGRTYKQYYINFVASLTPNGVHNSPTVKLPFWPQWAPNRELMHFTSNETTVLKDDFRFNTSEYYYQNISTLYF